MAGKLDDYKGRVISKELLFISFKRVDFTHEMR